MGKVRLNLALTLMNIPTDALNELCTLLLVDGPGALSRTANDGCVDPQRCATALAAWKMER